MTTTATSLTTPRRPFAGLLLAAADVYTAGALLYLLLRIATGERFWPVALANVFAHWWLLPAPVLAVVMLAARRPTRAALMAVPALAYAALFGGLLLPHAAPQAACAAGEDGCASLTVMTFNAGGFDLDAETFAGTVQEADADVVAVQELSVRFAAALDAALAEDYPYRALHPHEWGLPGIGLLSRYPILDDTLFDLEVRVFPYQRVRLDVDGQIVTVISAHPPPPGLQGGYHSRGGPDMPALAADIAAEAYPVILVGDFNAVDQSADYRVLREAGLQDAFREAGSGYGLTFPVGARYRGIHSPPLVRIDYVWATRDFVPVEARVGPDLGSDHLPVIATLRWKSAANGL